MSGEVNLSIPVQALHAAAMVKTVRYLTMKGGALEYAGVGISGSTLAALLSALWGVFVDKGVVMNAVLHRWCGCLSSCEEIVRS